MRNRHLTSLDRSHAQQDRDKRSKKLKIGDWVRFCSTLVQHAGKLAQIVDWADDGFNSKRAWRNKYVLVHEEPHIYGDAKPFKGRLQNFLPVDDMEVLAECAR
jgi:hypothetical protein